MTYESMTISRAIGEMNRTLYLPAIQRPYVWKQEAIISLFDSMMQGFPISSFLFWQIEPVNRRRWAIYKFQGQHVQGDSWNEKVEPDGRNVVFVLDGQQRLTSLMIGLQGSFSLRERYGRKAKTTSYRPHHLYLDLFKDPDEIDEDDEVTANRYAFKFSDGAPRNDHRHLWIKVGDILDHAEEGTLQAYRDRLFADVPDRVTTEQLAIAAATLGRLHKLVWVDEPISTYTETVQNMDRVLSIFIRANEGGTKLVKADLLMAVLNTTWGETYVRDEILGLVNRINRDMGSRFGFDKDLVMRACLVIPDLPTVYQIGNFTAHNMAIIRDNWDLIRRSIEATVALAARFGLDESTVTSMNALIPIAYYISRLDGDPLTTSSAFDSSNRERIRRWLFSSLINGAFGGNSDQTIGVCRDTIRLEMGRSRDFPIAKLVDEMRSRRSRNLAFDDEGINKLLAIRYGGRYCYLALSLLYDGQLARTANHHIDHIIPTASLGEEYLRGCGVPGAKIETIRQAADSLGNLQILVDRENQGKSDRDFQSWLQTREEGFLKQHLIPLDPRLWRPENLLEFIEARGELIRTALKRLLIVDERPYGTHQLAAA